MSQNVLHLKVLKAKHVRDVCKGIARIDHDSMGTLNASTGDVIEIKGRRGTVARCLPLYPSDEGRGIIRIDGLGRSNSGIKTGNTITIRKIKAAAAGNVVVAPLEAIPPSLTIDEAIVMSTRLGLKPLEAIPPIPPIDERHLADALESIPLTNGDNMVVPYFGRKLTFHVIDVTPAADAVLVTQKTVFHIAEKGKVSRGIPRAAYEGMNRHSGK